MIEEKEIPDEEKISIPATLPVLLVRDIVFFPLMAQPLFVGREKSKKAIDQSLSTHRLIFLLTQKDPAIEEPKTEEIYQIGTVGMILRMLKLPDGRIRIFVQGLTRAKVESFSMTEPYFEAKISILRDEEFDKESMEVIALMRSVRSEFERTINLGKQLPPEFMILISNIDDPGKLADITAANLELKVLEAQEILEIQNPVERLKKVYHYLRKELEVLELQQHIAQQAKGEIDKSQREYFLRQQLKAIQQELGESSELQEEIKQMREKLEKIRMPKEAREEVEKNIKKLERMHPDSAETAVVRNYLEWMLELPWDKSTKDNLNINRARKILDEDHYGLDKVKERIIEILSVRKLNKKMKGPILCFVGPPGVGKTSLGKSIARALGRKFVRMSIGGIRDEAEIRGHRRTYVGALPGRIIQGLRQANSNNPVFMLDEVDKIGADYRGDPSSALLEVLDPEQNYSFRDHYLGVPFDLSKVMFITTANILDTIHPAFLDRMEVIHIPGYTEEEKIEIAKRHLLPKQIKENGLKPEMIQISDGAIKKVISQYTREAGVRNLERQLASLCRKVAKNVAEGKKGPFKITEGNLHKFLGPPKLFKDMLLERNQIGVATGLAWTATGGDIIFVETTIMKGKGALILTGSLGDVMKESAQAALSYTKAHAVEFGIDENFFSDKDIHLHIPEGAIPKDGPSAGITIAVSMISAFSGVPVRRDAAMTGEITLRGSILPVGGIKEKVLAARRAGIKEIILPEENSKDLEEIPEKIRGEMKFKLVREIKEALEYALLKEETKEGKLAEVRA
ncbi:MAG: endopeptidase La [Candidatus Aminicenantia bacterium]